MRHAINYLSENNIYYEYSAQFPKNDNKAELRLITSCIPRFHLTLNLTI